ncbi:MAG: hypothetical protein EBW46_14600 [Rhodobacterales bacterium]|jgi:hypothetical protein|nr:hypothetical protein [Rhodobacterales bacterium]|tara:strand:+ start:34 stop:360 length:327 start_codon:yes stop_codon:yes gene_type:complete
MTFDDINKALIDLLEDGKSDTFVSMMSEDFEMLSIHKSSVGAKGKNREEAIEMMNKLETIADADVKCQIQTPDVIVVTHNSVDGEITLAANQIKDGKINKCVYFRGPK